MAMLRTSTKAKKIAMQTIPGFFRNQPSKSKPRKYKPLNDAVELEMTYINENPIPKNF